MFTFYKLIEMLVRIGTCVAHILLFIQAIHDNQANNVDLYKQIIYLCIANSPFSAMFKPALTFEWLPIPFSGSNNTNSEVFLM